VLTQLVVGFDSAWTAHRRGAIVAALRHSDGRVTLVDDPAPVTFAEATKKIDDWRRLFAPERTMVMVDQPLIVKNESGQRPVEKIFSSLVGRRGGGIQPAYRGRADMFGDAAPVWAFLDRLAPPCFPLNGSTDVMVVETYPVGVIIASGWLRPPDHAGRSLLPKYNPERRTFRLADWQHVRSQVSGTLSKIGLDDIARYVTGAGFDRPSKAGQDQLDACICLLVGLHAAAGSECLVVGNADHGYILVPSCDEVMPELRSRCAKLGMQPEVWLRSVSLA
jgi:predicted RNase H-like nuclease